MILDKNELIKVKGGETTATILNAISRGISAFLELGRSIGSAIRRATSGKTCSF